MLLQQDLIQGVHKHTRAQITMKRMTTQRLLPLSLLLLCLLLFPYSFTTAAAARTANRTWFSGKVKATNALLPKTRGSFSVDYQQDIAASLPNKRSIESHLPLWQCPHQLLFLQGSWHRQHQRDNISVGLGQRWMLENGMGLGYNLFHDQLLQHNHHRASVGVEGWWQALSLSTNAYFPLTAWQHAPPSTAHLARPAHGFDLAIRGHLATLPHLEGSLLYIHFLGKRLDEAQQLQPHSGSWALGVRYTPIPLLELHYRYRAVQKKPAQHQVGLRLTYRFHQPLEWQFNATRVATLRSAPYRLVDQRVERQLTAMTLAYTDAVVSATPKLIGQQDGQDHASASDTQNDNSQLSYHDFENDVNKKAITSSPDKHQNNPTPTLSPEKIPSDIIESQLNHSSLTSPLGMTGENTKEAMSEPIQALEVPPPPPPPSGDSGFSSLATTPANTLKNDEVTKYRKEKDPNKQNPSLSQLPERNELMEAIRRGVTLKKIEQNDPKKDASDPVEDVFKRAMTARRVAMMLDNPSDSNDWND